MSHVEDLSAITTPALTDLLYAYQNGDDFKLTNAQLLALMKENIVIPLTQAQYDALPSADKNNGALYIITDASITTADISDFSTFIHDLSFPSSVDGLAEIPVNITSGVNAGQKKVLVNQLTSVIQASTNLDDLNDVVTASIADGDFLAWDATGGISGNGGWMNKSLSGLCKIIFSGNITKTIAAGATIGIAGNELGALPAGYTAIGLLSQYTTNTDVDLASYDIATFGTSSQFGVLKNRSTSQVSVTVNYRTLVMKSAYVS